MYSAYNFVYVCKLSKTTSFVHIKYKVNTLLSLYKDVLARVHSHSTLLYLGCLSNFSEDIGIQRGGFHQDQQRHRNRWGRCGRRAESCSIDYILSTHRKQITGSVVRLWNPKLSLVMYFL